MIRALLVLGVTYRLRRAGRLFAAGRLREFGRVHAAVGRDLERLRRLSKLART